MSDGYLKMIDETSSSNKDTAKYMAYKNWIYFSLSQQYKHLQLHFQCKKNGSIKVPIELPITKPFYLLPYGSSACQQVKWMVATTEWIKYDLGNTQQSVFFSGTLPFYKITNDSKGYEDITMYYCHYQSCNYTLKEKEGIFQSPGFPLAYPDGQLCSWRITVPANHTVHVHFKKLWLYENDIKDVLEVYQYYNGTFELTKTFHGFMEPFTLTVTTDLLFKFLTNEANHTLGFQAEYTILVQTETTPHPTGVSSPPTITAALPSENVPSSSLTTEPAPNNNTKFALQSKCKGVGTTVVIVTALVCSVTTIIVIGIAVYRYRCNQTRSQKTEKDKERVFDKMATNPIYDQGDVILHHPASTSAVNTTMEGEQIYQNTATINTTKGEEYRDGEMYQILSRDEQPEYESPDYSKQNDTTNSKDPEYHELEPINNNVPDVVYDLMEGPNPNYGQLDTESTDNPLYQTASMENQNQLYNQL